MSSRDFDAKKRGKGDPIKEMLGIFISNEPGTGAVKMQSDLTWEPAVDIVETEREFEIVVDIAGMSGKDISVVTDGKLLKISGIRRNTSGPGRKMFHKLEIPVGRFEREITLPVPVSSKKVSARYEQGYLRIRILKAKRPERARRVKID